MSGRWCRSWGWPGCSVLAIAHWESKAHRDAKDDSRSARVKAILEKHAKVVEVSVIGEYDEPEWQVLPQ